MKKIIKDGWKYVPGGMVAIVLSVLSLFGLIIYQKYFANNLWEIIFSFLGVIFFIVIVVRLASLYDLSRDL